MQDVQADKYSNTAAESHCLHVPGKKQFTRSLHKDGMRETIIKISSIIKHKFQVANRSHFQSPHEMIFHELKWLLIEHYFNKKIRWEARQK